MKKTVFLPVFAAMAIFSQAWAAPCQRESSATFCQWDTGCYAIDDVNSNTNNNPALSCDQLIEACIKDGSLYTGVTGLNSDNGWGENLKCSDQNGAFVDGNDPNKQPLGCCKWDNITENPDGKCWTIWDTEAGQKEATDCQDGTNVFWEGACPTAPSGACPTSIPPAYNGADNSCGDIYCRWKEDEPCYKIVKSGTGTCEAEISNCKTNSFGKKVYTNATCTQEASSSSSATAGTNSSSSGTGVSELCLSYPNGIEHCKVGVSCLTGYTCQQCIGISGSPNGSGCPTSSSSTVTGTTSSSSVSGGSNSSSSSAGANSKFDYCYMMEQSLCLDGPFTFDECRVLGGFPSTTCPTTPIIVLPKPVQRNSISAMQNAVNLQITGSAAIQVFDLKGNMLRSLKFAQGNYVVPLSDLPRGLYIVKASNASWKQTIKMTVR